MSITYRTNNFKLPEVVIAPKAPEKPPPRCYDRNLTSAENRIWDLLKENEDCLVSLSTFVGKCYVSEAGVRVMMTHLRRKMDATINVVRGRGYALLTTKIRFK